jgi:hypothetical protein
VVIHCVTCQIVGDLQKDIGPERDPKPTRRICNTSLVQIPTLLPYRRASDLSLANFGHDLAMQLSIAPMFGSTWLNKFHTEPGIAM